MGTGIFITGTDTGVGKTRGAALLVRALRAAGWDAVGFKPICCGGREDAVALNDVNLVWLRPATVTKPGHPCPPASAFAARRRTP